MLSRPRVWHCEYLGGGGINSLAFLPVIAAPNVFSPAAGSQGYFVACRDPAPFPYTLAVNHHPHPLSFILRSSWAAGEFHREEGSWEPEKERPGKMAATHVPIPHVGSIKGCPLPETVTLWGRLAVCVFPSDCLWRSSLQCLLKFSGVKCDGSEPQQGPHKAARMACGLGSARPWTAMDVGSNTGWSELSLGSSGPATGL